MTLTQRADDADMLVDIARVTGLGRLRTIPAQRTSRPQVSWSMHSKLECRRLAGLLRRYPLRRRKRREFEVWAAAVDRWSGSLHGSGDATTHHVLEDCATKLRDLRRYVDQQDAPTAPQAMADGREKDHPEWPTRDTIALAFGGWARALEAAGLGSRVSDRARARAPSSARSV
jgi:hypothetical protein